MKDQVLSIEQMKHLYELGVDTSNASMCWVNDPEGNRMIEVHDEFCYEMSCLDPVPTFTLQDMLEIMPAELKGFDLVLFINNHIQYEKWDGKNEAKILVQFSENTLLDTAYCMLCWLAENNLLGKEEKR